MAPEFITVEQHVLILVMNYMPHLLIPFALYWRDNHVLDLVISCQQIHMHEV